jgi:hypothetical protein
LHGAFRTRELDRSASRDPADVCPGRGLAAHKV